MAKIYWTKEVKQKFNDKIYELLINVLDDEKATDDEIASAIKGIRSFRDNCSDIFHEMEEIDRLDDEENQRRREKAEAKDADT